MAPLLSKLSKEEQQKLFDDLNFLSNCLFREQLVIENAARTKRRIFYRDTIDMQAMHILLFHWGVALNG